MKTKTFRKFSIWSVLLFSAITLHAQDWNVTSKTVSQDRAVGDWFGFSTSISGNYAIISAIREDEDENGNNDINLAGSAYIYALNSAGNWSQVQKIVASDRDIDDRFGNSVSISGNYAIVGAFFENHNVDGLDSLEEVGSAYIYEMDQDGIWSEVQKIIASDRAAFDHFGENVDISGNYAIVASQQESEDSEGNNTLTNSGSVYIFERGINGVWTEVQKITAPVRANNDNFGNSVAISGDYALIGAFQEDQDSLEGNTMSNSGSAYIFERNENGEWIFADKLCASDRGISDWFGIEVAIDGDIAVVGAGGDDEDSNGENTINATGSAYIFKRNNNSSWSEIQKITASDREEDDYFGRSISISENYLVVGNYSEDDDANGDNNLDNSGSAYIFHCGLNGIWTETNKITASQRAENDYFGKSVAISGYNILVSAYREDEDENNLNTFEDAGSAYFFKSCITTSEFSITTCDNYVSPSGKTWLLSGIYTDTIPNTAGCDSIITIDLTILNTTRDYITVSECDSYTSAGGKTFTSSGTHYDTLVNAAGCDSIIIIELTILESSNSEITEVVCNSYTSSGGQLWTNSGIYTDTILNAAGCDSIITINLTVLEATESEINASACYQYTSPSGKIWDQSGIYIDTISNAAGCDSTITINLTVLERINSEITEVVCNSYTSPSGKIWTTSGVFADTIPASTGCDSTITVNLTVLESSESEIEVTTCYNYTSPNGKELNISGVYTDTIPNTAGCDSIITINLTILKPSESITVESACDSYTLPNGQKATESGIYSDTLVNAVGCDSLIKIEYTILKSTESSLEITQNGSYTTPSGKILTESGIYYDTIPNAADCDSILTINLELITGVFNSNESMSVRFFPNPVKDELFIQFDNQFSGIIELLTIDGKVVLADEYRNVTQSSLNTNGLPSGLYIIKIESQKQFRMFKVIKQD